VAPLRRRDVPAAADDTVRADPMSDVTGRATGLPTPQVTGPLSVGTPPPTAVGAGSDARAGWGWVAPYIGMIWPNVDSAKLRAAAAAWTTAGANFMATETAAGGGLLAALAARQIPAGAAINKALSDASVATIDVGRQCETIAAQLTGYAAGIDQVHAAILDLLSRRRGSAAPRTQDFLFWHSYFDTKKCEAGAPTAYGTGFLKNCTPHSRRAGMTDKHLIDLHEFRPALHRIVNSWYAWQESCLCKMGNSLPQNG